MKELVFCIFCFIGLVNNGFSVVSGDSSVRRFKNHISLAAHITRIDLNANLSSAGNRNRIEYKTETAARLGMSFDYRWLAFELFARLPFDKSSNKGKTQNSGIYGRINKSRFWANVIYQNFSGFYWSNPDQTTRNGIKDGSFPLRPDIKNNLLQVNAFYIFKPDRFSNPASQGENERQKKSGGSFFAGLGFYANNISGDSSLVPQSIDSQFDNIRNVRRIRSWLGSLNGGYAYCFVLKKKWYATVYAAPGLARFTAISFSEDQNRDVVKGQWTLRLESRISVGYNSDKYFGGVLLSSFFNNQDLDTGIAYSYSFQTFRVFFGKRFALSKQLGFLGL